MEPLVRAAAIVAAISALTRAAAFNATPSSESSDETAPAGPGELPNLCPRGTLPDGRACVPVPRSLGGAALAAQENEHRDPLGRLSRYEQIPRRPERPEDYRRYRYPIPAPEHQNLFESGYDLDRPDSQQRRGPQLKAVGHGGLDIAAKRGAEVRLVNLEHQEGDAEVLFVGELFGNSLVSLHSLREGGELRHYLVIYGHLDGQAPGLKRGMTLREGSLLGFAGDSGSAGAVHLHLEVRRVRHEVDAHALKPRQMVKNSKTVVCDPRNVMPLAN